MSKRFTDTEKYSRPWYRKLEPKYKCFRDYLFSKCSASGIWNVDFETAEYFIGEPLDNKAIRSQFKGKYIELKGGAQWFIPSFLNFQYGVLNESCNPHKAIIGELKRLRLYEGYIKGTYTLEVQVQDKVQVQVLDKDKDKEQLKDILSNYNSITGQKRKYTDKVGSHINARLKEGNNREDLLDVVKKKYEEWKNDDKMSAYIRPETLFGTKFDIYKNQKKEKKTYGDEEHRTDYDSIGKSYDVD